MTCTYLIKPKCGIFTTEKQVLIYLTAPRFLHNWCKLPVAQNFLLKPRVFLRSEDIKKHHFEILRSLVNISGKNTFLQLRKTNLVQLPNAFHLEYFYLP